jgi:hypothetical protein
MLCGTRGKNGVSGKQIMKLFHVNIEGSFTVHVTGDGQGEALAELWDFSLSSGSSTEFMRMLRALKRRRLCTGLDGAAMSINNTVGGKQQQREKETKQKAVRYGRKGKMSFICLLSAAPVLSKKVGEKERNRERER